MGEICEKIRVGVEIEQWGLPPRIRQQTYKYDGHWDASGPWEFSVGPAKPDELVSQLTKEFRGVLRWWKSTAVDRNGRVISCGSHIHVSLGKWELNEKKPSDEIELWYYLYHTLVDFVPVLSQTFAYWRYIFRYDVEYWAKIRRLPLYSIEDFRNTMETWTYRRYYHVTPNRNRKYALTFEIRLNDNLPTLAVMTVEGLARLADDLYSLRAEFPIVSDESLTKLDAKLPLAPDNNDTIVLTNPSPLNRLGLATNGNCVSINKVMRWFISKYQPKLSKYLDENWVPTGENLKNIKPKSGRVRVDFDSTAVYHFRRLFGEQLKGLLVHANGAILGAIDDEFDVKAPKNIKKVAEGLLEPYKLLKSISIVRARDIPSGFVIAAGILRNRGFNVDAEWLEKDRARIYLIYKQDDNAIGVVAYVASRREFQIVPTDDSLMQLIEKAFRARIDSNAYMVSNILPRP